MSCPACASEEQVDFSAEMIIHFSGLKNLNKPGVWLFPKVLICSDCGYSRFSVPEEELTLLASGAPKSEQSTAQQGVNEVAIPVAQ
jgi:hypothetical protein